MRTIQMWMLRAAVLVLAATVLNGCTYMSKRGNDALDIFDVGITVNKTPQAQFALYIDQFTFIGLGYANVDATLYGICNSKAGALDYTNHNWNVIAWGSLKDGAEPFNPKDPYQARPDQLSLTERPEFDSGLVRTFFTDNHPPKLDYTECRKIIHLGYVGAILNCHPLEFVDFLLGWTTLDIMHDDSRER